MSECCSVKGHLFRWKALSLLFIIGFGAVRSNTLIESFALPRDQKEALQISRFVLVKHSNSNQAFLKSKHDRDDEAEKDWRTALKEIVKESGNGPEHWIGGAGHESTEIVSIKPNTVSPLRFELSKTPLPQTYSYFFLVDQDGSRRRTTEKGDEKLFDAFSNSIDRSTNALLRFFGAQPLEQQRFSVRLSWDASDHVDLHLDLDQAPGSLSDLATTHSNLSFFNLTITPNFDKFADEPSHPTDSFVDLFLIIEPLLLNALPMFTLLPLISTCVCILSVVYFAGLPSRFESFIKNFLE